MHEANPTTLEFTTSREKTLAILKTRHSICNVVTHYHRIGYMASLQMINLYTRPFSSVGDGGFH
jgi:transcriptional regulator of NAD metabolism